jgi:hypothetical protein
MAHVRACPDCREALAELKTTAGLLDLVDVDRLSVAGPPPSGLDARVIAAVERDAARERRRSTAMRWGLGFAAAAAALALVAGGSSLLTQRAAPSAMVVTLVPAQGADAPAGSAALTSRPWGTQIDLAVEGTRAGATYRVWIADSEGTRTPAGTFIGQDRPLRMTLAAAVPSEDAVEVGISSEDTDRYLVAPL